MKNPLSAALLASVAFAVAVAAQAPAPPSMPATPAGCLSSAREYRQALMKELQARLKESGKPTTQEDVSARRHQGRSVRVGVRGAVRQRRPCGRGPARAGGTPGRSAAAGRRQADHRPRARRSRRGRGREGRDARDGRAHPVASDPPARHAGPGRGLGGRTREAARVLRARAHRGARRPQRLLPRRRHRRRHHQALDAPDRTERRASGRSADAPALEHDRRGLLEPGRGLGRPGADREGPRPAAPRAGGTQGRGGRRRAPRADDRAVRTGRQARGRHRGAGVAERARGHREARHGRRRDVAAVHRALVRPLPRGVPGRGAPAEAVRRARASAS